VCVFAGIALVLSLRPVIGAIYSIYGLLQPMALFKSNEGRAALV
jgi:hypothetical protein